MYNNVCYVSMHNNEINSHIDRILISAKKKYVYRTKHTYFLFYGTRILCCDVILRHRTPSFMIAKVVKTSWILVSVS